METDWEAVNERKFREMAIFAAQKNAVALMDVCVKIRPQAENLMMEVKNLSDVLYRQLIEARVKYLGN